MCVCVSGLFAGVPTHQFDSPQVPNPPSSGTIGHCKICGGHPPSLCSFHGNSQRCPAQSLSVCCRCHLKKEEELDIGLFRGHIRSLLVYTAIFGLWFCTNMNMFYYNSLFLKKHYKFQSSLVHRWDKSTHCLLCSPWWCWVYIQYIKSVKWVRSQRRTVTNWSLTRQVKKKKKARNWKKG